MIACTATPQVSSFASSFIAYADCQSRTIGGQGYLALAANGSAISQLISALMTIVIAIFGYRLLLGEALTLRDGVITLLKIGFVVAFTTGWPAYRTIFFDTAIMAPGELGSAIGGAAHLPGAASDLGAHLDAVDQQFQLLSLYNVSRASIGFESGTVPPPLFAGFDIFALGAARVVFLTAAAGAYCATRIVAGLLLALGPLFIAFLLFDATRGLAEGWVKILFGAALGTLAASIILGSELALLEPWLANLIASRSASAAIPGAAGQLLAATIIFALALLAGMGAVARATYSLRIPAYFRRAASSGTPSAWVRSSAPASFDRVVTASTPVPRSRAQMVADAASALDRRDAAAAMAGASETKVIASPLRPSGSRTGGGPGGFAGRAYAGQNGGRRIGSRVSASARRRDQPS